MTTTPTTAADIAKLLDLHPHPEGGYYRRTYKNELGPHGRGHASAIYYLLEGGGFARWHQLDADELWFYHSGAPITLECTSPVQDSSTHLLGPDISSGQRPQILIPKSYWQRARSEGDWTLVSCCVTPGFSFEIFRMEEDT